MDDRTDRDDPPTHAGPVSVLRGGDRRRRRQPDPLDTRGGPNAAAGLGPLTRPQDQAKWNDDKHEAEDLKTPATRRERNRGRSPRTDHEPGGQREQDGDVGPVEGAAPADERIAEDEPAADGGGDTTRGANVVAGPACHDRGRLETGHVQPHAEREERQRAVVEEASPAASEQVDDTGSQRNRTDRHHDQYQHAEEVPVDDAADGGPRPGPGRREESARRASGAGQLDGQAVGWTEPVERRPLSIVARQAVGLEACS